MGFSGSLIHNRGGDCAVLRQDCPESAAQDASLPGLCFLAFVEPGPADSLPICTGSGRTQ
jgi:hypothetical protein